MYDIVMSIYKILQPRESSLSHQCQHSDKLKKYCISICLSANILPAIFFNMELSKTPRRLKNKMYSESQVSGSQGISGVKETLSTNQHAQSPPLSSSCYFSSTHCSVFTYYETTYITTSVEKWCWPFRARLYYLNVYPFYNFDQKKNNSKRF